MNAQDSIQEIEKLPPEEKQIVVDYVVSAEEEEFLEENYSPEDLVKLDRIQDEIEKGVNMSPELEGEEAVNYLRKLRKAQ